VHSDVKISYTDACKLVSSISCPCTFLSTGAWRVVHKLQNYPFVLKVNPLKDGPDPGQTSNMSEFDISRQLGMVDVVVKVFARKELILNDIRNDVILVEAAGETMYDYVLEHAPVEPCGFCDFFTKELVDETRYKISVCGISFSNLIIYTYQ